MTDKPSTTASPSQEHSLLENDPWRVAWRQSWLLLLGGLFGLGGGWVCCNLLPAAYQSTAEIWVSQKRPDAATGLESRPLPLEDFGSTQQELVKSALVVERAVREQTLTDLPSLRGQSTDLTDSIRKGLSVTRGKGLVANSNVLQVSFRGADAVECRTVLNAVLISYRRFLDQQYQTVNDDTLAFLLKERDNLDQKLAQQQVAYREFLEKSPLLPKGKDALDLGQERLASIQTKRSVLLLRRLEIEGQLAALETAQKQGASREALLAMIAGFTSKGDPDDPHKEKLPAEEQLLPLLLEEQQLLASRGKNHPDVQAIQQRIAIAREMLARPAGTWNGVPARSNSSADSTDVLELHLQVLRGRLGHVRTAEDLLTKCFDTEQGQARKLAVYALQEESYRTHLDLTKQACENMNKRLQGVSLVKDIGGYDVQVINPPSLGRKVAPSTVLVLPTAAFLGVLAGLGLGFVREMYGRRLRRPAPPAPASGPITPFDPARKTAGDGLATLVRVGGP